MGKGKTKLNINDCKHPNSRKTKALVRDKHKQDKREAAKRGTLVKQTLVSDRITFLKDHLPPVERLLSNNQILEILTEYINRFDEEMEDISLKNSIGDRKKRQYASRQDYIKMTLDREKEEFETCGLEIPDLTDPAQVKLVRSWEGDLRFLQHFKMKRFNRAYLSKSVKITTD